MLEPSIDSLQERINSKYSLITLAARRARQLREDYLQDGKSNENTEGKTYVSIALEEIQQGKLQLPKENK